MYKYTIYYFGVYGGGSGGVMSDFILLKNVSSVMGKEKGRTFLPKKMLA